MLNLDQILDHFERIWQRSLPLLGFCLLIATQAGAQPLGGFNLIQSERHRLGSAEAEQSFDLMAGTGACIVALIPFLWQPDEVSIDIVIGNAVSDAELVAGIRAAKARGLSVLLKPHVWVPERWAGAIDPPTHQRNAWFDRYAGILRQYAGLAEREKVDALALGTELVHFENSTRWRTLIAQVREIYGGRLTYVAHGLEGVNRFQFWDKLDFISLSLYPPLGEDPSRAALAAQMKPFAQELAELAARYDRPVWIAEVGLMSVEKAQKKPWISPEEYDGPPDPNLQALVLALWIAALDRPGIEAILVWRWFTDPNEGGLDNTDFTVQGKPAEKILRKFWQKRAKNCTLYY